MRCFNNETRSSHELNDTKFRFTRSKVQKIYTNLIEIEKLEMREMSTRITFSLECSVFGLSVRPPKRIPRCVSRCATKAQQVRAAPPKRANARKKTYDHFSFFLSLSLSFFEYNSSPCSKILKIVVPADVSQWHQSKLTMKGKGVNLGEAFKTALETKCYLLNSLLGEYPRIGIQIRDVKIV